MVYHLNKMENKPAGIKSGFDFDAINDPTPRESLIII
jgi:hypothetical protein